MSWIKDREEFKQAALSSARAISRQKDLSSTSQASSRPPTSAQIALSHPPRASAQINAWRGELDFQTFWQTFHQDTGELKMPKLARDIFAELELSRVEMLGGSTFPGAQSNIQQYLETEAKKNIDNKAPALNPLAANLWLKELNGELLAQNSSELLNAFLEASPLNLSSMGKKLIEAQASQSDFQAIALELLKNLDLMHEAPTQGDDVAQENEEAMQEHESDMEDLEDEAPDGAESQTMESESEGQID